MIFYISKFFIISIRFLIFQEQIFIFLCFRKRPNICQFIKLFERWRRWWTWINKQIALLIHKVGSFFVDSIHQVTIVNHAHCYICWCGIDHFTTNSQTRNWVVVCLESFIIYRRKFCNNVDVWARVFESMSVFCVSVIQFCICFPIGFGKVFGWECCNF